MDKDKTITDLKKQVNILRIVLIILFLSNAVVAFIKLQTNTAPNNTENIAVLREQKASLQTSVEIKKCIEGIVQTNDVSTYSQQVLGCIKAANKLYNIDN